MTIERTLQGAWRISDIIDGHLVTCQYFGYSRHGAIALFKTIKG